MVGVVAFFKSTNNEGSDDPVGNDDWLGAIENVGNKDGTTLVLGAWLALGT